MEARIEALLKTLSEMLSDGLWSMLAFLLIDALYEANQRDVDKSFEAEIEVFMLLVKDCLCERAADCNVDKL